MQQYATHMSTTDPEKNRYTLLDQYVWDDDCVNELKSYCTHAQYVHIRSRNDADMNMCMYARLSTNQVIRSAGPERVQQLL